MAEHVSAVFLHYEIDSWLADPFMRQRCIELWQELGGPSHLAAYPGWELRRQVRERLSLAFDSGELVAYRRARPSSSVAPAAEAASSLAPESPVAEPARVTLEVLHLYHDDTPIQGATYEVTFNDGSVRKGKLGNDGRLRLEDVPPGPTQIQFGPDARPYERADAQKNKDYRESWSKADLHALVRRGLGG